MKYLPPFHEILVQKIPIQKCFWLELLNLSTDFQTFCNFLQTKCSFVPRKYEHLNLNSCKISAKNHYQTLRNTIFKSKLASDLPHKVYGSHYTMCACHCHREFAVKTVGG